MRILLTRARDEAQRTAEKLKAAGHKILVSPVIEMQPLEAAWPDGIIDAVIATSAAAFELAPFTPDCPLPEARRLMRLFVVGLKTAEAARKAGFTGQLIVAPDAKDLAAAVIEKMPASAQLIYLAGRDRKPDLEMRCREAELELVALEVYEARAGDYLSDEAVRAFNGDAIDAVLHYSRRSAEIFLSLAALAGVDARSVRHLAISADAAEPLQDAAYPHVEIAAEPKEQSLLALLPDATPDPVIASPDDTKDLLDSISAATRALKALSAI
ncbi:MAG: uroporphyrinogen-III synthase [Methylovirgula sp.]